MHAGYAPFPRHDERSMTRLSRYSERAMTAIVPPARRDVSVEVRAEQPLRAGESVLGLVQSAPVDRPSAGLTWTAV